MPSGAGVTSGVPAGLALSSGKRWIINKGLTSARLLPEGLRASAPELDPVDGPNTPPRNGALCLARSPAQSCNSSCGGARWGCSAGVRPPPPPRRSAQRAPAEVSRGQCSDFHERDLEALHHALHVEDEGVLIRVVLDDVVIHVHQDAAGEGGTKTP